MTEVYKALLALGCVWHAVTNYRVLVIWTAPADPSTEAVVGIGPGAVVRGGAGGAGMLPVPGAGAGAGAGAGVGVFANGPPPESTDRMDLVTSASGLDLPALERGASLGAGGGSGSGSGLGGGGSGGSNNGGPARFKIALSLYKVQQNIYLLDFQRVEGDVLGFMRLCALVIAELKNLSAANRALAQQLQQQQLLKQLQQGGGDGGLPIPPPGR